MSELQIMPARDKIKGKTLVLGCGNEARGDDGLGPALIKLLEAAAIPQLEIRLDYQLRVEDAMDIGGFQQVIFVDACRDSQTAYKFYPLPTDQTPLSLDTHSTSPQALMQLARTLFNANTPAAVLAIRGYEFEPFEERLSDSAQHNLQLAFDFLLSRLGKAA